MPSVGLELMTPQIMLYQLSQLGAPEMIFFFQKPTDILISDKGHIQTQSQNGS